MMDITMLEKESERFDILRHVFLYSADPMIKYDDDHNTMIKINETHIFSSDHFQKYPKRILFKDFLNIFPAFINTSGVNISDVNGNYKNINNYFTQTGGPNLFFSKNYMIDSSGDIIVFNISTSSWLKVADT
jgi:hypothetical protein